MASAEWDAWGADPTPATFRVIFPEFSRASDALVSSRIAMAEARTPLDIWGDLRPQGLAWLAAHLLAMAPEAKDMRKGEKPGETMYKGQRDHLALVVSSGFRVAGLPDGL